MLFCIVSSGLGTTRAKILYTGVNAAKARSYRKKWTRSQTTILHGKMIQSSQRKITCAFQKNENANNKAVHVHAT